MSGIRFGAGENPGEVVLQLKSSATRSVIFDLSAGMDNAWSYRHIVIGNMTLSGPKASSGIVIGQAYGCTLGNLVIKDMKGDAILIDSVRSESGQGWREPFFIKKDGMHIENNTIVNCQRGITINKVNASECAMSGVTNDGKRVFCPSRVENNIVVFGHALGEGAAHGIRIGSSSGDADQQCLAWNPFTNPFGDDPDQTGNPWVPVKYNWVWGDSATSPTAFMGTNWYRNSYRISDEVDHQERFQDPQMQVNYRLHDGSPASTAGCLYRLDVLKKADGFYYGKRRGLGAFESSNPDVYSIQLTN